MSATGDRPAAVQRALDLGSHAHLGHVQIPIDDKLTGSLPHEASVSSRPARDRNERRVHRPHYSRPRRVDGPVGRTRAPGTRILRLPVVCPLRRSRKSHCGVNVSGGNARRREPQGHDQSRPCPTKTEPNGRGGEPLPTGMGRQIDDHEPARSRYRPTPSAGIALGRPATSRPLTHCRGKRSTYDAGPWSRKITTQCCWPRTRPRCGRTTPSQLISADSHIPVTGPRQAWSLWQELRNTRWK